MEHNVTQQQQKMSYTHDFDDEDISNAQDAGGAAAGWKRS